MKTNIIKVRGKKNTIGITIQIGEKLIACFGFQDTWVRFEATDRGDTKLDLKSRGLCLVPTSCTPQVYHENNGSDYWTPTYRGCFYR